MPSKPKNRVVDIDLVEIAFVEEGDNPAADLTLFKLRPPEEDDDVPTTNDSKNYDWRPRSPAERIAAQRFYKAFAEVRDAFTYSVNEILCCVAPDAMGEQIIKAGKEFQALVKEILDDVNAKEFPGFVEHVTALVEATTKAAATGEGEAITKALAAFEPEQQEETNMPAPAMKNAPKTVEEILAALPEDQRAVVKATLDAQAKAAADAEEAKRKAEEAAANAAKASTDAAAVETRLKAAEDAAKAAAAEVAKLKEEQSMAEFRAKAREIAAGVSVGITVDEMAVQLKAAYGRSADEGAKLEQMLKALTAQARKAVGPMLSVVGSSAGGKAVSEADDPLDEKAKELMKADPKLTYFLAYEKAADLHPDLAAKAAGPVPGLG